MKFNLVKFLIFAAIPAFVLAAPLEDDPFAELDAAMSTWQKEGSQQEQDTFSAWKQNHLTEYQVFRKKHFQELDEFRDHLINTWGDAEISERATFVQYSQDNQSKTVLDYEKNQIRLSVLHDANQAINIKMLVTALTHTSKEGASPLAEFVGQPSIDMPLAEKLVRQAKKTAPKSIEINEAIILAKEEQRITRQTQIQKQQIERLYDIEVVNQMPVKSEEKIAIEITTEQQKIDQERKNRLIRLNQTLARIQAKKAKVDNLTAKQVTTYTISLPQTTSLSKAQLYVPNVLKQSQRWQLTPSLMLAIMHTESHFNPQAQSHIPAYGLMQIVPHSASIDVNRYLYDTDAAMSKAYLFDANNNIEAGVAYLHLLNSRYLASIENTDSRLFCIIAAYNTGSGNVAKAFSRDGSRNMKKAAKVINQLSPQQVYNKLLTNLPYKETRNYLKKVVSRRDLYAAVDKKQ